jgi:phosphoribosylformylglycinamidine synthase subunit PurL
MRRLRRRSPALLDVALRGEERQRIAQVLGREPTRVELRAFDAQWSEHCSYKSSRAQLRRLPTSGEAVVLGPGEDAGILHLGVHEGERYGVVVAHESHNHPSQVVPFEGAATGVGGIVRDVLCMGAEVIAIADALRFGDVSDPASHQRHVAQAVVEGIGAYGNAIGVPNIAGDVYFHEGFNENCLVNVIALGLVREREIVHSFAPPQSAGWPIVLVGKATDASGFGGASFSSLSLDVQNEAANKGAVQVPDPFLKNVLMRATYRVFSLLHARGITAACKDLGAGGVMGCSAEICASGGFGARIELERINVSQEGLAPEVLAVGETQERLLFVIPPEIAGDVLGIYNEEFTLPEIAHNARAVVIGNVTREKRYVLTHRGDVVMDVDIGFLTGPLEASPRVAVREPAPSKAEAVTPNWATTADELAVQLSKALSSLDVCSREPLYRHYDGVVRGRTVIPRGRGDAGVIAPIPGSKLGVAIAVAGNPRYGRLDPALAAEYAVLESVRKVVAVGATPIGLTDCLNFGNPNDAGQYGEFVSAVDGLERASRELGIPFVSGNVSFYNETSLGKAIPASAVVACIGRLEDAGKALDCVPRESGAYIVYLGRAQTAMGAAVAGKSGPSLLEIDYEAERKRLALLLKAIELGSVQAVKTVGAGGPLCAAATMAFGTNARLGPCTGWLDVLEPHVDAETSSFAESGGWLVVLNHSNDPDVFEVDLFDDLGRTYGLCLGTDYHQFGGFWDDGEICFPEEHHHDLAALFETWRKALEEIYP